MTNNAPPRGITLAVAVLCALSLAQHLTAQNAAQRAPYSREAWGRWADTEHTGAGGCRWDVRQWELQRVGAETSPGTLITSEKAGRPCRVVALTIVDEYTGRRITGPAKRIDVDHLVPLAEAWRSGAAAWTAEKRHRFFNDQLNHSVVSESTNASKSDIDPGGESAAGKRRHGWLPENAIRSCRYLLRWQEVKSKWGLTMDRAERSAVDVGLALCAKGSADPAFPESSGQVPRWLAVLAAALGAVILVSGVGLTAEGSIRRSLAQRRKTLATERHGDGW
jgi:hypothetical protein